MGRPPLKPALFASIFDQQLLGYGVPPEWLEEVKKANEETLLTLADHLPKEAAEALLELATGVTPQAPVVVLEGINPLRHPDAQRRFRVMSSITTSALPRHTFPETLLRHFVFSGHLPLLLHFAKSSENPSCSESHSASQWPHQPSIRSLRSDHDSPVQTPSLIEGGGLPTQTVGAYCAPQHDPGSPA